MTSKHQGSYLGVMIAGACSLFFAGCGGSAPQKANVSGTITYKGVPVTGGNLKLHYPAELKVAEYIVPFRKDGTFNITDVPPGNAKVTIETETIKGMSRGPEMPTAQIPADKKAEVKDMSKLPPPPADGPVYMKIPAKYASPTTTPFTWDLKLGANKKEFELTD